MIRVTLAEGAADRLDREIEARRSGETFYDFMVRSGHETALDAKALRALVEAHKANLVAERAAVVRQRRWMVTGQGLMAGAIACLMSRPDTLGDALILAMPVAILTLGAGLVLSRLAPGLDQRLVRAARRWRQ